MFRILIELNLRNVEKQLPNDKNGQRPTSTVQCRVGYYYSCILYVINIVQFFYSVDAQDDEGDEEDIETAGTNSRNDNDDNSFTVIIPENAAWSQSVDQRFNSSNITIPVGAEVTWINEDESEHTVTSGNVANQVHERIYDGRFYSGVLGSGDSFSHTFNEPGIYSYFCSPHPWMICFVIIDDQDADTQSDDEEDSTDDEEGQDENDDDDDDE
jgi:plastocyanin